MNSVWMLLMFMPLLMFAPLFAVMFWLMMQVRSCPACGGPLRGYQSPFTKTRRQWIEGGYLCGRCGCESDRLGRIVPPDTPGPAIPREMIVMIVALAGLVAFCVVLVATILIMAYTVPHPPVVPVLIPRPAPADAAPNPMPRPRRSDGPLVTVPREPTPCASASSAAGSSAG